MGKFDELAKRLDQVGVTPAELISKAIDCTRSGDAEGAEAVMLQLQNFQGVGPSAPAGLSNGPATAGDQPPPGPITVAPVGQVDVPAATQFSSNPPPTGTRDPAPLGTGPSLPPTSFGPSRAPANTIGGDQVGRSVVRTSVTGRGNHTVTKSSDPDVTGEGLNVFGTDTEIASRYDGRRYSQR